MKCYYVISFFISTIDWLYWIPRTALMDSNWNYAVTCTARYFLCPGVCRSVTSRSSIETDKRNWTVFRHWGYACFILQCFLETCPTLSHFFLIFRYCRRKFITLSGRICLQQVCRDAERRAVYLRQMWLAVLTASSGKRNVTACRSVCLHVLSAYTPWLTRGQHATPPAYNWVWQ